MSTASLGGLSASAVHPYEASVASDNISADSFIVRDVHQRRQRRREELEGGVPESSSNSSSFFGDLLQQLRYCCAGRGFFSQKQNGASAKAGVSSSGASPPPGAGAEGFGTSSGPRDLRLGQGLAATVGRMQTYSATGASSSSGGSSSGSGEMESERRRDRFVGDLSRLVAWRVGRSSAKGLLSETASLLPSQSPVVLTTSQAAWTAVLWAVRVEENAKISGRLLEELLQKGSEQPLSGDLSMAIKTTQEFKVLDFERKVQGIIAEDVLGEFTSLLYRQGIAKEPDAIPATASPGVGVFMVIQKGRVFGLHGRMRGELLDFCLFDPVPTERELFGPSFAGFKKLEDMLEYVVGIYKRDPRIRHASCKERLRSAEDDERRRWGDETFAAKQSLTDASKVERRIAFWNACFRAAEEAALEDLRAKDPKFDAKLVYTAMYNATTPKEEKEVFAMEPGVGMQIEESGEMARRNKFMTEEEEAPLERNEEASINPGSSTCAVDTSDAFI